ncbi:hypothetical protein M7775_17155 [Sporomusa sphaeroides DSM 2875]|uniref:hypothetical protein n=1 Tax=Sporomusa sphaeroides TaxID=47679 RepID=UPI0020307FF5|nr:hypothetical protein [Sporomusa sphaeroides]MCM0760284.1 hypothetical protein [Sporomusa sphaeroides DSM 2875]
MHITIDVNIKGLEGLLALLNQVKPVESVGQTGTVVQMPTPAPTAAPVITTAAAPQLSVVPATAPAAPYPVAAPMPTQAPVQMQAAVPVAAQTYTVEQLGVAATQLMDAGRQPELIALLGSFGVQALTQLPKEQYGNFATQLRAMGAKI